MLEAHLWRGEYDLYLFLLEILSTDYQRRDLAMHDARVPYEEHPSSPPNSLQPT